jgi:hypothetical protein
MVIAKTVDRHSVAAGEELHKFYMWKKTSDTTG